MKSTTRRIYKWKPFQRFLDASGLSNHIFNYYYLFTKSTHVMTIDSITVELTEVTIPARAYYEFEKSVMRDVIENIRPNDVFWDVGAAMGLYTCPIAKTNPEVTAVAFEPDSIRRKHLEHNLRRNELGALIRPEALYSVQADSKLSSKQSYSIQNPEENDTDKGLGEEVMLSTGDILVQEGSVPTPNILKIDAQGTELEVLRGLEDTLETDACRLVYVEVHDAITDFNGSEKDLKHYLRERGFSTEWIAIDDKIGEKYLRARK